jgi:hypothetical protein
MASLFVRADEPNVKQGQLEEKATHVVIGTVKGVYACEKKKEKEKGVTFYVIEIEVQDRWLGEGPKKGEVLYVRCWRMKEKSKDPNANTGQAKIPVVSEHIRVYLKRGRDGGYDLLGSNGIGEIRAPFVTAPVATDKAEKPR